MTYALVKAAMAYIDDAANIARREVRVTTKAGLQFFGPIQRLYDEHDAHFAMRDMTPGSQGATVFVSCADVSSIQTLAKDR